MFQRRDFLRKATLKIWRREILYRGTLENGLFWCFLTVYYFNNKIAMMIIVRNGYVERRVRFFILRERGNVEWQRQ